ncbi:GNAT family N-acetyltransferase [Staphylococcus shinii]|uniref:GNAT family N-acetyltransferase n=1 Tax=Staphylococcus shinii TaxID=2912228 RepID=UPI003F573F42
MNYNEFNQPIGSELKHYPQPSFPSALQLEGLFVKLEKLNRGHINDLFKYFSKEDESANWTYLPEEPITDFKDFEQYIQNYIVSKDPYFFAIVDKENDNALGIFSLMRINITDASIEVGHIQFSNILKKTRMATEAHFLLAEYVFETLGYRRYEWKCDDLNNPSKKSAARLGFIYEGTFRQHKIYKHRNRDTSWFSILDKEWHVLKEGYKSWLKLSNFDEEGIQKNKLTFNK